MKNNSQIPTMKNNKENTVTESAVANLDRWAREQADIEIYNADCRKLHDNEIVSYRPDGTGMTQKELDIEYAAFCEAEFGREPVMYSGPLSWQ